MPPGRLVFQGLRKPGGPERLFDGEEVSAVPPALSSLRRAQEPRERSGSAGALSGAGGGPPPVVAGTRGQGSAASGTGLEGPYACGGAVGLGGQPISVPPSVTGAAHERSATFLVPRGSPKLWRPPGAPSSAPWARHGRVVPGSSRGRSGREGGAGGMRP